MERFEKVILISVIIIFAGLLYIPHIFNPFPIHIDEWKHITEALYLRSGDYSFGSSGLEFGFHFFLFVLSFVFNLVKVYHFLPVIWGVISAITLFFVSKSLVSSDKASFLISIFSVIFFASIKSNVNTLGLWFFIPLTFCIPFVYAYLYFIQEGIRKKNYQFVTYGFLIMGLVLITHAISVLAFIPALVLFFMVHRKEVGNRLWYGLFGLGFLSVLFYMFMMDVSIKSIVPMLLSQLIFERGWGVFEYSISPLEIYSFVGLVFAVIGLYWIYKDKRIFARYELLVYSLITLLFLIGSFMLFDFSPFSPFQRNVFYVALILPLFSSLGVYFVYEKLRGKYNVSKKLLILFLVLIVLLTFWSYFSINESIRLYQPIDVEEYEALRVFSTYEKGVVIAPVDISIGLYPISRHQPIATSYFYGNQTILKEFYGAETCLDRSLRLPGSVDYIISHQPLDCGWTFLFSSEGLLFYKI